MDFGTARILKNGKLADGIPLSPAEEHIVNYFIDAKCFKADELESGQAVQDLYEDLVEHFSVIDSGSRFRDWVAQKKIEFRRVHGFELDEAVLFHRQDMYLRQSTKKESINKYTAIKADREKQLKAVMSNSKMPAAEKEKRAQFLKDMISNLKETIAREKSRGLVTR